VIVHAGVDASLTILVEGIGGHRQDRRLRVSRKRPDRHGGLNPVQVRHLNVHQYQGVAAPAGEFQRLLNVHAGTRILLAEGEPVNQEVSRCLLEDVGLVVDLAEDGQQALELARQNHYALILMDMQMPNLNGVDATKAIRELPGYDQTPILAMTANAFDEDRQRCLDAGMNDHIGKPVDPNVLFETLSKWLEWARKEGKS